MHGEEKRDERDRGDQKKRECQKRRDNVAIHQFPKCSPQSGTPRETHSYIEKKRGMKEIDMTMRRRGLVKVGNTILSSNQFPKCSPQPGTLREITELSREEKGEGRDRGVLG